MVPAPDGQGDYVLEGGEFVSGKQRFRVDRKKLTLRKEKVLEDGKKKITEEKKVGVKVFGDGGIAVCLVVGKTKAAPGHARKKSRTKGE